jgi:hypothetical protein
VGRDPQRQLLGRPDRGGLRRIGRDDDRRAGQRDHHRLERRGAFSGAALFTGSVIHPHNLAVPQTVHAVRRWGWLTLLRIAYYAVVATLAALAGSTALTVVAVLTALSAPSFQPIQMSVLYGYRSEVVVVAVRWGWILAPLGLVAAALVR